MSQVSVGALAVFLDAHPQDYEVAVVDDEHSMLYLGSLPRAELVALAQAGQEGDQGNAETFDIATACDLDYSTRHFTPDVRWPE